MTIPATGALSATRIGLEFPDTIDGGNPFRMSEYRGSVGSRSSTPSKVTILPRASDNAPISFSDFRGFQRTLRIDVFLVGGGGAGGDGDIPRTGSATKGIAGGGGGAGAVNVVNNLIVNVGQTYNLQSGGGGSPVARDRGNNGSNSYFIHNGTQYLANGGGGGGSGARIGADEYSSTRGRNGGCGGGGGGGSPAGDGVGGDGNGLASNDGIGRNGGDGVSSTDNAEGGGGGGYATAGEGGVIGGTNGAGGYGYRNRNTLDQIFIDWMGLGALNTFFDTITENRTSNTIAGGGGGGRTTGNGDGSVGRDYGGNGAGLNPNNGNYNKPSTSGLHRTGSGGGGGLGDLPGSRGGNGCVIVRYRFGDDDIPDYIATSADNTQAATGRNQIDADAYRFHIYGRLISADNLNSTFTVLNKLN